MRLLVSVLLCFAAGLALVIFPLMYPAGLGDPRWLLGFVLVCAACGLFTLTRNLLLGLFTGAALLLALLLFTPAVAWAAAQLTLPPGQPRVADGVVILTDPPLCGADQLPPANLTGLARAVELWQAGYTANLILPRPPAAGPSCSETVELEQAQLLRWFPDTAPRVFAPSSASAEPHAAALAVADLAQRQGWNTLLLVAPPLQLGRAVAAFRQTGLSVTPIAAGERLDQAVTRKGLAGRLEALPVLARELAGIVQYRWNRWM